MTPVSTLNRTLCWVTLVIGITTGWQPVFAQEQQDAGSTDDLTITIVEGDGGINNIKKGIATKPVVEVHDRNKRPVAGALVTFTLPNYGPSGAFADGSQVFTVTTDAAGRATAAIKPNNVAGQFKINVHASFQGHTGTTSITQTNALAGAAAGSSGAAAAAAAGHSHLLVIAIAVGAAVAGGVAAGVALNNGGSSKPPTPTGTIGAPGTVTIGPQH
ncbi:MAG TPA: hypothetical protein VMJ34_14050 [Bryobacteraceae bacterium]|nr:hypothetical protein [Bryobacteraceae bacterium]